MYKTDVLSIKKLGWLVERLPSPFSIKVGHIRDKVLGGDSVPPVQRQPKMGKDRGGSFKLLC